jgi:hypothetical protein
MHRASRGDFPHRLLGRSFGRGYPGSVLVAMFSRGHARQSLEEMMSWLKLDDLIGATRRVHVPFRPMPPLSLVICWLKVRIGAAVSSSRPLKRMKQLGMIALRSNGRSCNCGDQTIGRMSAWHTGRRSYDKPKKQRSEQLCSSSRIGLVRKGPGASGLRTFMTAEVRTLGSPVGWK